MKDSVQNRLKAFLRKEGVTQKDFTEKIDVSSGYVNSIRSSIQPDKLARIRKEYPQLDIGWLMTGEGSMYSGLKKVKVSPSTEPSLENTRSVLFFPNVEAIDGKLFEESSRAIKLALPRSFDCDFALPIAGEGMSPLYRSGDIILIKKWSESFIEFGKVYLIVTSQGSRLIKYLRPADEPQLVLCTSENAAFESFTIPRSDISALYIVKGCISLNSL